MFLLVVTIGVLTGVAMGLWMTAPLPSPGAVALALLLCVGGTMAGWNHRPARWAGIMLLVAVLSGVRAQFDRTQLEASALPAELEAVRGTVGSVPRPVGRAAAFIVDVDGVLSGGRWEERSGRIGATTFGWVPAESDRVEITGEVRPLVDLPGAPRATILRHQRVTQEIQVERTRLLAPRSNTAGRFDPVDARSWMEDRISTYLDAPHSGLLAGLLVGSRSEITPEVRAQFAQTGTSHIVAVSGFNVVIVSGFVGIVALRPLGVRGSALAAVLAVIAYTLVVGAPPSAVRAAIMAGMALSARIVGRPADALNGLMIAGAGMALVDPLVIQDLGFQLSMLATAGLILLIPHWERARSRRTGALYFAMTPLAAQVATLPLVLHTFHSLSLIALVANMLVAPMLPVAMAAGGLLVLVADVEPLAIAVSWLAWLAVAGILESIRMLASVPGAWIATGAFPVTALLGSYLAILLWVFWRSPELRRADGIRRLLRAATPVVLAVSLIDLWLSPRWGSQLSGELLDFGELMVARSPSGKTLVMGTEVSPQVLTASVAERLPFWKRSIDIVIVNDDSPASWRGVQALTERYAVDVLVAPRSPSIGQSLAGVGRLVEASDDMRIDLGDGSIVQLFSQPTGLSARSRSVPFALAYGSTGLSFPVQGIASLPSEREGWITVIRDGPAASDAMDTPAQVRWGRWANQSGRDRGALDLVPRAVGPITFASDGYQLTIRWSGCSGPDSACTSVIGGAGW